MPTPEQSQYTPPKQGPRRDRPELGPDYVWLRGMPTQPRPGQPARPTPAAPARTPMAPQRTNMRRPSEDGNLERAINRLPFFAEYERVIYTPGGTTTLSNTNAIDMNLTTDGLFYVDFEKYETWTDIKVRITMSGYVTTSARIVNISGVISDQSGVETTVTPIAKFAFNTANEHHSFYGEARVGDLIPGKYRLQFQWRVTANSFEVNVDDAIFASVIECIPIPET